MTNGPYSRFRREELTLRDELAVDRTALANERTLLAYVRTGLGFLILGLTFLHFLEQWHYHLVGYGFMVVAVAVLTVGVIRFLQMGRELKRLRLAATEDRQGPDQSLASQRES